MNRNESFYEIEKKKSIKFAKKPRKYHPLERGLAALFKTEGYLPIRKTACRGTARRAPTDIQK
jgi:hypothetical protein